MEKRIKRLERIWLAVLILFAAVTTVHIYTLHHMLKVIRALMT